MTTANMSSSTSKTKATVTGTLPQSRLERQFAFLILGSCSHFSTMGDSSVVKSEADSDVVAGLGATLPVWVSGRCCGSKAGATGANGETGETGDGGASGSASGGRVLLLLGAAMGFNLCSMGVALASAAIEALVGPSSGYREYGGSCSVCPKGPRMSCSSPSGPICL